MKMVFNFKIFGPLLIGTLGTLLIKTTYKFVSVKMA